MLWGQVSVVPGGGEVAAGAGGGEESDDEDRSVELDAIQLAQLDFLQDVDLPPLEDVQRELAAAGGDVGKLLAVVNGAEATAPTAEPAALAGSSSGKGRATTPFPCEEDSDGGGASDPAPPLRRIRQPALAPVSAFKSGASSGSSGKKRKSGSCGAGAGKKKKPLAQ